MINLMGLVLDYESATPQERPNRKTLFEPPTGRCYLAALELGG